MSKFFAFKVQRDKDNEEDDFMGKDDVDPLGGGGEVFDEDGDNNSTTFTSTDDVYHLVDQGRSVHFIIASHTWFTKSFLWQVRSTQSKRQVA